MPAPRRPADARPRAAAARAIRPSHLVEPFAIVNRGRARIGKPSFAWDDTLYKIVQDLVEKAWSLYLAGEFGETDAHWDFIGRGRRHGWTGARAEYGVGGDSACKDASGKVWPRDRDNWCHPPVTATWAADNAVRNLLDRGLPPNEGHVRDFRGPWTHAAIGHHQGMFAIEYGTPS
jgi:hypothetical protein